MRDKTPAHYVAVDQLEIGMFVHLDLGWLSHPFPRSNFRITTQEQIDTIRGLGLERVRWEPDKSSAERVRAPYADTPGATAAGDADAAAAAALAAAEAEAEAARARRRVALAGQRETLRLCEQRFAEAAHACARTFETVDADPARARAQTEALVRGFVEHMAEPDLMIRTLAEAAGDKAAQHALNVTVISLLMGRALGLANGDMFDIGVGALLHDIGKAALPPAVRHPDDGLTPAQLQAYQQHVAHGIAAARRMELAAGALSVIGQHHEHADGSGFPLKLNTDRMSIGARIVALVNRYDNLCNPNVGWKALTPHEALSLMFAQGKNSFDTAVMGVFIKMMGIYPPGSVVQLTDDRFAVVVAVNSNRPLKPRVLVHDAAVPRDEALLLDLETQPSLGIRRSIRPLALPREVHDYLAPRPRVVYFFEPMHQQPEGCEAAA